MLWMMLSVGIGGMLGAVGEEDRLESWIWEKRDAQVVTKRAKKVKEQDGRFRLRAGGWSVETEVDAKFTAEVSCFMEKFEAAFDEVFPFKATQSAEPTVIIYERKSVFAERFPNGERGAFTYTWTGKKFNEFHLYTYVDVEAERSFENFPYPVLQHEGAHALLRRMYGLSEIPVWYDEALGAWFQSYDLRRPLSENRTYGRYGRSQYFWHLRRLCGKYGEAAPPVAVLTDLRREGWNPDQFGTRAKEHYGLAETLGDFLVNHPKGKKFLKELHEGVRKGRSYAAVDEKWFKKIEPLWQGHVQEVLYFRRDAKPKK